MTVAGVDPPGLISVQVAIDPPGRAGLYLGSSESACGPGLVSSPSRPIKSVGWSCLANGSPESARALSRVARRRVRQLWPWLGSPHAEGFSNFNTQTAFYCRSQAIQFKNCFVAWIYGPIETINRFSPFYKPTTRALVMPRHFTGLSGHLTLAVASLFAKEIRGWTKKLDIEFKLFFYQNMNMSI